MLYLNFFDLAVSLASVKIEPIQSVVFKYVFINTNTTFRQQLNLYRVLYLNTSLPPIQSGEFKIKPIQSVVFKLRRV